MSTTHVANTLPLDLLLPQGTPPELTAAIADAARNVLDHHGAGAFAAPREAAMAHEIGHAIVGTHEGLTIRQITLYSRPDPILETVWGGHCLEAGPGWKTGPDTSVSDDLRRARFLIAGLAGEAVYKLDGPGSSLDELGLSQLIAVDITKKLEPGLGDAEREAYTQSLWHERVWKVAISILYANQNVFHQLAKHLYDHEQIKGAKLDKVLAQVKRIRS